MQATTETWQPRRTPGRVWFGALCGAVAGWLLAITGVLVSVPHELDEKSQLRYRVKVLGVQVYRYPEDGEVFEMRPYPQMLAWRDHLAFGFALAGAALGGAVASFFKGRPKESSES